MLITRASVESEEDGGGERLKRLAREAEALSGKADEKLQKAIKLTKSLLKDGFSPIIFCRLSIQQTMLLRI